MDLLLKCCYYSRGIITVTTTVILIFVIFRADEKNSCNSLKRRYRATSLVSSGSTRLLHCSQSPHATIQQCSNLAVAASLGNFTIGEFYICLLRECL